MKTNLLTLLMVTAVLLFSCAGEAPVRQPAESAPAPAQESAPAEPVIVETAPPAEETFDANSVSEEVKTATLAEVRHFIGALNTIIAKKDFNGWKKSLDPAYYDYLNSPDFLAAQTDLLYKRDRSVAKVAGKDPNKVQRKNLTDARAYFFNVVVESHRTFQIKTEGIKIEFVSPTLVKALYYNELKKQDERVYLLLRTNEGLKQTKPDDGQE